MTGTIRIGTAEHESTFTTQGIALRTVLKASGFEDNIEIVEAIYASTENAIKLGDGALEFGFIASNWIGRAFRGEAPFTDAMDLRMVAPMNAGPMYFISRAGSGIDAMSDLRGRTISVGPSRSGTRQHAHSILGALGMTFDDFTPVFMDFASGAEALAKGEIDAQLQCPYPNKVMTALDAGTHLKVIPLREDELAKVMAASPIYRRVVMPKGSLRALKEDALQPAVLNVLVAHARTDAKLVARVTAAIHRNAEDLERLNPLFTGMRALFEPLQTEGVEAFAYEGVPVHEGAVAAYETILRKG